MTYIEGAVVNTGTIDITKAMVDQETIVIAAGDGNKLVEFRVKAGAFDGILSPSGEKSVSMEFDLLKKDESIAFSALVEQGNPNSPLLVIDSRIAQVDVLESLNTGYIMSKTFLSNIIITFFVVAVSILLGAISSDQNPYEYLDDNGNIIEVDIIPKTDRTVDIVHVRMKYGPDGDVIIANLEETEIFRTDRISISTETDSVMWPLYIGIVLVCLAIAYSLIEYVRGRRLRRLTARIVKAHFPDARL